MYIEQNETLSKEHRCIEAVMFKVRSSTGFGDF